MHVKARQATNIICIGGLITFAYTVIFLFTLDISGKNRFCVVAWCLSSFIHHFEHTDANSHRNGRVFRSSGQTTYIESAEEVSPI